MMQMHCKTYCHRLLLMIVRSKPSPIDIRQGDGFFYAYGVLSKGMENYDDNDKFGKDMLYRIGLYE